MEVYIHTERRPTYNHMADKGRRIEQNVSQDGLWENLSQVVGLISNVPSSATGRATVLVTQSIAAIKGKMAEKSIFELSKLAECPAPGLGPFRRVLFILS